MRKGELTEDVRAWYRAIGTGFRVFSKEKRSLIARMTAARRIATQRARYGPSLKGKPSLKAKGKADAAIAWSGDGNPDSKPSGQG